MFRSAKEKMRESVNLAIRRECRRLARGSPGSQLLELALSLPILLVLAVGGSDFGGAYNLKQKLNNAAREGARFGGAVSNSDSSSTSCGNFKPSVSAPCSVQGIQNVVIGYLSNTQTQVGVCGMTTATNPSSSTADPPSWTYTSSCSPGTFAITIERGYTYLNSSTGGQVVATCVTVSHPYSWSIGRVIGLLGGSFPDTITITSNAVFQQNP